MNATEKQILGVDTDQELMSVRDAVLKMLVEQGRLNGAFEEHVRVEEQWQTRVEQHLKESDGRTREIVAEELEKHREESAQALKAIEEIKAIQHDRRAVQHWLNDGVKRLAVLLVAIVLAFAGVMLWRGHHNEAAEVITILAACTPFLLLLFRRQ